MNRKPYPHAGAHLAAVKADVAGRTQRDETLHACQVGRHGAVKHDKLELDDSTHRPREIEATGESLHGELVPGTPGGQARRGRAREHARRHVTFLGVRSRRVLAHDTKEL